MEVYGYLIRCLGKQRKIMPVYVLLLLFTAVMELFTPQLYHLFVDQVLLKGDLQVFGQIVAGYCMLFMAGCAASVIGRIILNRLRNGLEYRLRQQALNEFIYPKKENALTTDIGDVKLKMDNDICKLSECLQEQFGRFEVKAILLAFSAVYLFLLNWQLALLGVIAIPVTIRIDYIISRKENILNEKNRQNDSEMTTWLRCALKGWRQIKMFGQEKSQARKYVRFQHKYALHNAKWIHYWVTRILIIPRLKDEFLMEFGVYFIGGIMISKDIMTAGELLVFIVYYHLLTDSMTALSAYQASMQSDLPIYLRAMSWDRQSVEKERAESVSDIQIMELQKIRFRYAPELPELLTDTSGVFTKGDCVLIKGKSGSGKTTLVKLMLGLMSLSSGQITVNGHALESIDISAYYHHISGSLQGTYLFHASIRENLLYVKPDATEEELISACERAQILGDIMEMPDQLDTVAGERGSGLSGGQCQRVMLARAFLKDADVYFFDEVTSALDRRTAISVLEEIKKLSKEKIVFLISHDDVAERVCNKKMDFSELVDFMDLFHKEIGIENLNYP